MGIWFGRLRLQFPSPKSNVWSLADQALVSGGNFLCGILLARVLGIEAFGAYVVAQTYLLYANTFQSALVVSPMMTSIPTESASTERAKLLRGYFAYTIVVLFSTLVLVQLLGVVLGRFAPAISLEDFSVPLAAAMIAFQVQDWLRRANYAESQNLRVFLSDLVAYGGQFVALIVLTLNSRLTPGTALLALAFTFSVSSIAAMIAAKLYPEWRSLGEILRVNRRASTNFLASWQLQWVASSGVILIGTGMVGQHAAGAIRAVQNLLGPMNVYFQWMDNVLPVRATLKYRDSGRGALGAFLWRIGGIGIATLGCFAAVLTLVDEPLIVFLYGEEYRPFAILVVFQALYYLFGHAYRMASYFRRVLGETRELAIASAWWAFVALLVAFVSVGAFADRGIMLALVLGEVAGLIYLLTRHREITSTGGTHCVVRRADGSPHLLLPRANRKVAIGALSMYFPSRYTGKLYRWYLSWSIPVRDRMAMIETIPRLGENYPHVDGLLRRFPNLSIDCCGVLISAPGARSKLTLRLMDVNGAVHAYARIAYGGEAIEIVRREAESLAIANTLLPAGAAPAVLWQAYYQEPLAYCLVESAGPEVAPPPELDKAHFSALASLVLPSRIDLKPILTGLSKRIRALAGDGRHSSLCNRTATLLAGSVLTECNACLEHGDFAPWNLRTFPSGSLFLLDWEHSRHEGLPWMDALHFTFQMSVLVRRKPPGKVLRALMEMFELPSARAYRATFPELEGALKTLVAVYLARCIVEDAEAGLSLRTSIQDTRFDVLGVLLAGHEEVN